MGKVRFDIDPKRRNQNSSVVRRLEKNFDDAVIEELQMRYPQLHVPSKLEAFKRKWMYMFVYAEVGYARAYTSLFCWTFVRPVRIIQCHSLSP